MADLKEEEVILGPLFAFEQYMIAYTQNVTKTKARSNLG